MSIVNTLGFIFRHPLNRGRQWQAFNRFLSWQVASRLWHGKIAVDFVNRSRLLVSKGMTGATGNVYCGLHEFEDMSFVLHVLRPGDLFIDVGANIGSYTVLAGKAIGADCITIEPVPSTFAHLMDNLRLNDIHDVTCALNVGVGRVNGVLNFTSGFDTTNYVALSGDKGGLEVQVRTLDDIIGNNTPTLIKVDVEGFEAEVIAGGQKSLRNPDLIGVIMEINGYGKRYGHSDEEIVAVMSASGFETYRYLPFKRRLEKVDGFSSGGNLLFLKRAEFAQVRVTNAPYFSVHGRQV